MIGNPVLLVPTPILPPLVFISVVFGVLVKSFSNSTIAYKTLLTLFCACFLHISLGLVLQNKSLDYHC